MIELAFAVLAVGMFFIGYFLRTIIDACKSAIDHIASKLDQPLSVQDEIEEPKSMLVEPLTPEQQAQVDLAERVKRLNS